MKRLFTFGCSFTKYLWPTWADLLGTNFGVRYNWGFPGLGNRAIAERVAEAHARLQIGKDDVVVVQWTSHLRHDWMHFNHPKDDNSSWRTKGSIFSPQNQKTFDKKWMNQFWDEKAYYIHMLNEMLMVQGLLDSTGCSWLMTCMSDPGIISREVSSRTVDGEHPTEDAGIYEVWDSSPDLLDYKRAIWDNRPDKWVLPIIDVCKQSPEKHWWFDLDKSNPKEKGFNYTKDGKWMEPHPSVEQHALWLIELKAALGEQQTLTPSEQNLLNEFTGIKSQTSTYQQFENLARFTDWWQQSKSVYVGY